MEKFDCSSAPAPGKLPEDSHAIRVRKLLAARWRLGLRLEQRFNFRCQAQHNVKHLGFKHAGILKTAGVTVNASFRANDRGLVEVTGSLTQQSQAITQQDCREQPHQQRESAHCPAVVGASQPMAQATQQQNDDEFHAD